MNLQIRRLDRMKSPQIAVGKSPRAIAFDSTEETIYVANLDSNTVSVISTENNTKIKDIPEIYP